MVVLRKAMQSLAFFRGNLLVLSVTQAIGNLARSMVFPYASLYVLALGGEAAEIGLVNALRPLAGLIVFPLGGYLADRVGRVKLIGIGGAVSAAVIFLYVLAPSWEMLAIAGLLQGFMAIQFPATSAILADSLTSQDRGKGIAAMNMAATVLSIPAPYLAGALLDRYGDNTGMRILYAVMTLLYVVDTFINVRFLKETSRPTDGFRISRLPALLKDAYCCIPETLRSFSRPLRLLAVVIILAFTCNAIAGSFWVVYATQEIGLSTTDWGLVLLMETLLRNLLSLPAGWVVDRYGRTPFLSASLAAYLGAGLLFIFSSSLGHVLLARAGVALTNVFFTPACTALLADSTPKDRRGRVMAAIGRGSIVFGVSSGGAGGPGMGFLLTIPVVLGALVGGYVYAYNPVMPWVLVGTLTAVSLLLVALFLRDPKQIEE